MKRLHTAVVCALVTTIIYFPFPSLDKTKAFAQKIPDEHPQLITPEMVKPHIVTLADDRLEGRGGGYPGERKAADYIAAQFKKIGLKPFGDNSGDRRSYFQEFKFQVWHPAVPWEVRTSRNVLGLIEGTDAVLKSELVVIGAHYDGQGRIGQADPVRMATDEARAARDEIWNSANDNAASVAAILEIARAIKNNKLSTKRSLLFIAFGAEEHGMAGSLHYVSHPVRPLRNHVAMINLEKLGRSPEKPFTVTGAASSSSWQQIFKKAQERTATKLAPGSPHSFPDSDHYPFVASRIPAIMLYVQTSVDAHKASDTSDKIDLARVAQAARYGVAVLLELANQEKAPDFIASPIPDLGLVAHLITNAESDAAGFGPQESGLKVTGVVAGLPAAEAGLKEGDLIIEIAKRRFRRDDTVAALMAAHREILEGKFGNRLPVILLRDKKQTELVINLLR